MKKWCRTSDRDTQAMVSATGIGFHNELQIAVRKKKSNESDRKDSSKEEGLKCNLALVFGVPNGAFFDVDQLKSMEGILEVWVDDDFSVDVERPSFTAQAHTLGLVYQTSTSSITSYAKDKNNTKEMTRFREVSLSLPVHLRYPCPGYDDNIHVEVNLQAVKLKCDDLHEVPITTPFSFSTLASVPHMQCTVPLHVPAGRMYHVKFVQWVTPFVMIVGAVLLILGMWWHPISHSCSAQDSESVALLKDPQKKKAE